MSRKIIGVTVGSPLPKPDLRQDDPTKGDYVKGKEAIPQKVSQLENDSGYLTEDAVVPIVPNASGNVVSVSDSAERPLKGLRLFGKTTQNGTPTPDAPIPLETAGADGDVGVWLQGKNLFNLDAALNHIFYKDGDAYIGKFTVTGDRFSKNVPVFIPKGTRIRFGVDIIETTVSNPKYQLQMQGFYENGGTFEISAGATRPLTDNVTKMNLYMYHTEINAYTKFKNVQLEFGDSATAYEPFKEPQTLTVNTPNGLHGIPVSSGGNYTDSNEQQWLCDEIDFSRGKYIQRVETVVMDGVSKWGSTNSINGTQNYAIVVSQFAMRNCASISSHFVYGTASKFGNTYNSDNRIRMFYSDDSLDTADKWNAWFAEQYNNGTPVTVLVGRAEPIERDLTAEELEQYAALKTTFPNTTVTNDAGAGMELTYIADTKNYIDKKIAQLSAAIVAAGAI